MAARSSLRSARSAERRGLYRSRTDQYRDGRVNTVAHPPIPTTLLKRKLADRPRSRKPEAFRDLSHSPSVTYPLRDCIVTFPVYIVFIMDRGSSSIIAEPVVAISICLLVTVLIVGSAVSAAFDALTGN